MPLASAFPNSASASLVLSSRLRKLTMLPYVLTEFRIRLVREYAWIRPCWRRFLSTHNVFSVVASNPVRNMFTTITRSSSRFFNRNDKSL